ncbi:hypothetical protein ABID21_000660 [Pseudorhizobium tarimense]|uniref:Uncharacterized protein n=1 Tax=Pseudorhizobium tarimense TaxID=1079109 RepID=A0ABV2H1Z6_9HYPH|nr:hypothetical protein [Pseudorhizobium tarimense]MCJ8517824.1 hypothetical protein [Pseudorhizobium tarimense]
MKKAIPLPAKAGETTAGVADGKTEFRIRPGIKWINGRPVRDQKTVRLTDQEAAYDLGLSRISPADQPAPADWPSEAPAGGNGDGGN